jgi:cytidylate kinase
MKKSILMLMVAGLVTAMPAFAAEHVMSSQEQMQRCAEQNEAIDKKIERLQIEIKKGDKKYSAEELLKLEEKLHEANLMLDSITKP